MAMEGMPRKPRQEADDAVHHVFSRGNGKQIIFIDDDDRMEYVDLLRRTVQRCDWKVMAYCLMPNHMHLLIQTPKPNMGAGMQWFHGRFASAFNRRWRRSGHLFQGRYGSVPVVRDEQLWAVARYIAMNPVEARLCDRPEDFVWGSHRMIADGGDAPSWLDAARLLGYFATDGGEPRRRYLEFVTPPSQAPARTAPPR